MIAWILKILAKGIACLPLRWAWALGRHWGWMLAHVLRLRRTYVLNILARCFPDKTDRELRALYAEVCRQQALNTIELLRYIGGRVDELEQLLEVHDEEIVKEALARGKGVLILLAHFGNYDLMGMFASKLLNYPLTIITKTLKNEGLDKMLIEMRSSAGVTVLPARNAYRPSVRALKSNGLVGFMLDQNRRPPQGIFVDFFGMKAGTTPGLALMSAHSGAPVVPVFMHRTPEGRHVLEARPLMEPPPDREEDTLRVHTALYTKVIEEEVRRRPDQWLWLHKRWKGSPSLDQSEPKRKHR